MRYAMMLVAAAAFAAAAPVSGAPDPRRLPPELPPSVRDLPSAEPPLTIFTYTVDGRCRIADPRKLQGPDRVTWEAAEAAHELFREDTVWRFLDGERRQLRERRVKLRGEMVLEGELVCHLQPSGEVIEAWIERKDAGAVRRQVPRRDPVPVQAGAIEDLGTFSVDLQPGEPANRR